MISIAVGEGFGLNDPLNSYEDAGILPSMALQKAYLFGMSGYAIPILATRSDRSFGAKSLKLSYVFDQRYGAQAEHAETSSAIASTYAAAPTVASFGPGLFTRLHAEERRHEMAGAFRRWHILNSLTLDTGLNLRREWDELRITDASVTGTFVGGFVRGYAYERRSYRKTGYEPEFVFRFTPWQWLELAFGGSKAFMHGSFSGTRVDLQTSLAQAYPIWTTNGGIQDQRTSAQLDLTLRYAWVFLRPGLRFGTEARTYANVSALEFDPAYQNTLDKFVKATIANNGAFYSRRWTKKYRFLSLSAGAEFTF